MTDHRAIVTLRLPAPFVGQLVDGLDVLIEQWEDTAAYMIGTVHGDEVEVVRECSSSEEAARIARLYREIRDEIERQLAPQTRLS